jgi:hypothetical protein
MELLWECKQLIDTLYIVQERLLTPHGGNSQRRLKYSGSPTRHVSCLLLVSVNE